jgi:endonuclease/exonuclease/phosphatase family metal-dependent hydrolase
MSLNAWGGRLYDRLVRWLPEAGADVLCLQEVTRTPGAPEPWLDYLDGGLRLPQRANLFADLCAALPGHEGIFCPSARGDLVGADGAPQRSDWGLASFVRRGLLVLGQVQGFVHGDFRPDGFGPHPRPRNAHVLRLWDDRLGAAVTVAQMHGLRDPAGKGDTPARAAQAEAFVTAIAQLARPGERLVACGDFNLLPGSASFAALRARLGLSDLVTGRGHRDTRTSFYPKDGRLADYLLVSPEVEVRRFEVVAAPEVSDHRALLLELG